MIFQKYNNRVIIYKIRIKIKLIRNSDKKKKKKKIFNLI